MTTKSTDLGVADIEFHPPARPYVTPYVVLGSGEGSVLLPIAFAAAPSVADAEAQASVSWSRSAKAGLSIKIFGNGFGGSAKITMTRTVTITAVSGEFVGLALAVPVLWERRGDPEDEDRTWSHVEVRDPGRAELPLQSFTDRDLLRVSRQWETSSYDVRESGTKPFEPKDERTYEAEATFSLGFTYAPAGIEASLEAEVATSSTVELNATLPTGLKYQVGWWQYPAGVDVTAS